MSLRESMQSTDSSEKKEIEAKNEEVVQAVKQHTVSIKHMVRFKTFSQDSLFVARTTNVPTRPSSPHLRPSSVPWRTDQEEARV